MLVVTRGRNQAIVIPQLGVRIVILAARQGGVRVGVEAPTGVEIWREEIFPRVTQKTEQAPAK